MNKAEFCKRVRHLAEVFPGGATISAPGRLGERGEPALLPARCPFEVVVFVEIGPGEEEGQRIARLTLVPCTGEPRANSWCNAHQGSYVLLDLGHALGYPYVALCDERAVAEGRENWEVYARRAPTRWLQTDIPRLQTLLKQTMHINTNP